MAILHLLKHFIFIPMHRLIQNHIMNFSPPERNCRIYISSNFVTKNPYKEIECLTIYNKEHMCDLVEISYILYYVETVHINTILTRDYNIT